MWGGGGGGGGGEVCGGGVGCVCVWGGGIYITAGSGTDGGLPSPLHCLTLSRKLLILCGRAVDTCKQEETNKQQINYHSN